jgi:hypothetical protein
MALCNRPMVFIFRLHSNMNHESHIFWVNSDVFHQQTVYLDISHERQDKEPVYSTLTLVFNPAVLTNVIILSCSQKDTFTFIT